MCPIGIGLYRREYALVLPSSGLSSHDLSAYPSCPYGPLPMRGYNAIIQIDQSPGGNMAAYTHTTTSSYRVLLGLAVLWGIIGLAGGKSWAGDSKYERDTLRGVEGVNVVVEELGSEVERAGLTETQLQTDVELRLRKAGIRVLTYEERVGTPGRPSLYINVNVMLKSDGLAVYAIRVALHQTASLETDGSRPIVATWSVASIGSVSRIRFVDTIRNDVRDGVDDFINAYLSVHPRPAGSASPSSTSPRRNLAR